MSDQSRFWSKVGVGAADSCWPWNAYRKKAPGDYGVFVLKGKSELAHRVAYAFEHGPIPGGKLICHSCDNPPCCNPRHLFLGTQKENVADMTRKGRAPNRSGERHGMAKLTQGQVDSIRALYAEGGYKQTALGRRFGVSQAQIWRILNDKSWHL